ATAATKLIDELPRDSVTSIETADTKVQTAADTVVRAQPDLDRLEREFAAKTPGMIARLPDAPDFTLFNFGVNSTDLKRFADVLNNFGSFFADMRDRGYNVDIVGVASVSGTDAHNAELSFARALAVQTLYESRFGMPSQRMNARQVGSRMSPPPADVL